MACTCRGSYGVIRTSALIRLVRLCALPLLSFSAPAEEQKLDIYGLGTVTFVQCLLSSGDADIPK